MWFLIEYDRHHGELVTFETFKDSQSVVAANARLDLELGLNRTGVKHEVVLLEAETEAALRRTHRRYFESLTELVS